MSAEIHKNSTHKTKRSLSLTLMPSVVCRDSSMDLLMKILSTIPHFRTPSPLITLMDGTGMEHSKVAHNTFQIIASKHAMRRSRDHIIGTQLQDPHTVSTIIHGMPMQQAHKAKSTKLLLLIHCQQHEKYTSTLENLGDHIMIHIMKETINVHAVMVTKHGTEMAINICDLIRAMSTQDHASLKITIHMMIAQSLNDQPIIIADPTLMTIVLHQLVMLITCTTRREVCTAITLRLANTLMAIDINHVLPCVSLQFHRM
jgi:hypothetical protein